MAATSQQQTTGTRDVTYNLISVAYHALQGAETYAMYIQDAQETNKPELVEFFTRAQDQNRQIADQAKELLRGQLEKAATSR